MGCDLQQIVRPIVLDGSDTSTVGTSHLIGKQQSFQHSCTLRPVTLRQDYALLSE
jgi:hypothetical protein